MNTPSNYPHSKIYVLLAIFALIATLFLTGKYVYGQDGLTVIFVGDISCTSNGLATLDSIKAENPDAVILLGDMSYEAFPACIATYVKDMRNDGVTVRCNIGNHDSDQVESDALEKAYWNLCAGGASQGGFWKIQSGNITIFGINTQCDGSANHTATVPPCSSEEVIEFLKSIHKNRFVVATAHIPLCETPESKNAEYRCDNAMLEEFDRMGLTTAVSAHNHCSAFNGRMFIAGSGGRSHYACSGWNWIDDTKYAYLFMEYKQEKLDFVFRHFKTGAEISPHFLLESVGDKSALPISSISTGNVTRVEIQIVEGTVEFKDKNGTIYYEIPTAPGIAIPSWGE